jgi:Tol biopolymer transport system component
MRLLPFILAALLLTACGGGGGTPTPPPPSGKITFSGRVLDASGQPVSGAQVQLSLLTAQSGADGAFSFSLTNAGSYQLSIQSPGGVFLARTVDIPASGYSADFTLTASPLRFELVGVDPPLNSTGANLRGPVTLVFSRSVNDSLLTPANFAFAPATGEFTLAADGATITLTPMFELGTAQNYRLEVSGVLALDGSRLAEDALTYFTTRASDTDAPALVSSSPAEGATGVALNQSLELTFSDYVAAPPGGIIAQLSPPLAVSEATASGRRLVVKPSGNFAVNTDYTLTVAEVRDDAGNSGGPFALHFRTGAQVLAHDDVEPDWNIFTGSIVFARRSGGQYDLFTIRPDGTDLTRLTETSFSERHPRYSSDGTAIVHQSNEQGNWDIAVLTVATGETTRLTSLPEDETAPAFSGTFTQLIAYVRHETSPSNDRIYVMNSDGSFSRPADESSTRSEFEPVFHPLLDNQMLYISYSGTDRDIFSKSAFLDSDRPVNINLTEDLTSEEYAACWAPDGSTIAFISDLSGVRNIWVMDPSGSAHFQVTHFTDPVHSLAYSPLPGDDRVVVSAGPSDSRSLYLVSLISGETQLRLTQ